MSRHLISAADLAREEAVRILDTTADSPRSTIVEQVRNGVTVRMAVLYLLLGGAEEAA